MPGAAASRTSINPCKAAQSLSIGTVELHVAAGAQDRRAVVAKQAIDQHLVANPGAIGAEAPARRG